MTENIEDNVYTDICNACHGEGIISSGNIDAVCTECEGLGIQVYPKMTDVQKAVGIYSERTNHLIIVCRQPAEELLLKQLKEASPTEGFILRDVVVVPVLRYQEDQDKLMIAKIKGHI